MQGEARDQMDTVEAYEMMTAISEDEMEGFKFISGECQGIYRFTQEDERKMTHTKL